jgi:hypothetical protein
VNQEHLFTIPAREDHQKVAVVLTLGELLVEKTIPIGTLRPAEFSDPPTPEQIKEAFESYPWFKWKKGVMILEQKFRMDLEVDGEYFKDVCIDVYNKACLLNGEYTTFDMCQKRVLKTWTKFGFEHKKKRPPPPPPAPAAAAVAADSTAHS